MDEKNQREEYQDETQAALAELDERIAQAQIRHIIDCLSKLDGPVEERRRLLDSIIYQLRRHRTKPL